MRKTRNAGSHGGSTVRVVPLISIVMAVMRCVVCDVDDVIVLLLCSFLV